MLFDTSYKSITKKTESLFKDRGSKFIAVCAPTKNLEEFKSLLNEVKLQYPGAVHYCYAYRIGYDKQLYRINDDGEPSGSAGRPIYNIILSNDLTNVCIIVVRYFGGTLLGVPGLINAYKQASILAIDENKIVLQEIIEKACIIFEFDQMNIAMRIVKEYQLKILSQEAVTNYTIMIEVPIKNAEQVRSAFHTARIEYKYVETY
jgi:uncharacterized YigZ family protein